MTIHKVHLAPGPQFTREETLAVAEFAHNSGAEYVTLATLNTAKHTTEEVTVEAPDAITRVRMTASGDRIAVLQITYPVDEAKAMAVFVGAPVVNPLPLSAVRIGAVVGDLYDPHGLRLTCFSTRKEKPWIGQAGGLYSNDDVRRLMVDHGLELLNEGLAS